MRPRPVTVPAAAARSASASAARSSSASACSDEHQRRVGQAHAAPGALEQPHAGLALEHRELLGDGGRRELERVGDGGDRPALVQLAQQAQAAEVEHRAGTLLNQRQKSESLLTLGRGTMPAVRSSGTLICLASGAAFGAMAIFGKLAYDEGATVGTLLSVRFTLAAALFWALLAARQRGAGGSAAATSQPGSRWARAATRSRPAATSPRSSASTPRCCRCCSTRSRRWSPSRRSRSAASASTGGGSPRSRSPPAGSRWSSPAAGRARSTRSAPRSGSAPRSSTARYILVSDGIARRRAGAAARDARLHRRRGLADRRLGAARRAASGRAHGGGLGLAGVPRRDLDGRRDQPLLRRPAARRADDRLDPRHRRAARDRRAGVPRLRRDARRRCSSPAARCVLAAVLVLQAPRLASGP